MRVGCTLLHIDRGDLKEGQMARQIGFQPQLQFAPNRKFTILFSL